MTIVNPLPYNIQNGQAVDANPVMANLNQIVNDVNANAAPAAGNAKQTFAVANATASDQAINLGQANSLYAPISGSSGQTNSLYAPVSGNAAQTFAVANATASNQAVNLGQANSLYAPVSGNAAQAFAVANATASNQAINLGQANSLYAPISGSSSQGVSLAQLEASNGATLIGYLEGASGSVARTVASRLQELVSVMDFGAVGDGVHNEVPAFSLAQSNGEAVFIPSGSYNFSTAFDSGNLPMVAMGATLIPQVPATTFFRSYIDLGQKAITRQSIRGASEYSGTPTTYTYLNTLSSFNILHNNAAGYQQYFTSDAGGRTSVPAIYINGNHVGYGDVPGVSVHLGVQRHPSYASISGSFTGANSCVLFDGQSAAITSNVNVYGAEFHLIDNGNDRVAANGLVLDFNRTNSNPSNSGAYNTVWTGVRLQTSGTYPADSGLSINGLWNLGIDFSGATLSNNAAIALKTNDRIYFGVPATSPPNWWASTLSSNYQSFDGTKFNFVVNNVASLSVAGSIITSATPHLFINSIQFSSAGYISSTVGAAGSASPLPSAPVTYLMIQLDGTTYKIPVYNN